MKVAISIVSYNTKDLLKKSLDNLLSQKHESQLEVWVVDNASPDNSVEMLEKFRQIKLIKSTENGGFAKGHNLALKKIDADYVLILNPDTEVPNEAVDKMVKFMEDNLGCGIASCKIYGFDGSLHSNGGDLPFGISLIAWLFNLEIFGISSNFHRLDKDYYEKSRKVGWVGGTFMFVRSDVFKKIGYLNEDYFMYFEDCDFCYKAGQAGFDVMINSEVSIKHISGASSTNPRLRQWTGEFQGIIIFYRKQFGNLAATFLKLLIYKSLILRIIAFSLLGRFNISKTYGKILFTI